MSADSVLNEVQKKLICQDVFTQGLRLLKPGKEIRIVVELRTEWALFYDGEFAKLQERPAESPDVEFHFTLDALRSLTHVSDYNMATLGIAVSKQVIEGSCRVRVVGSVWAVLSGGYLKIDQAAGPDFFAFLSQNGLKNLTKIQSFIRTNFR